MMIPLSNPTSVISLQLSSYYLFYHLDFLPPMWNIALAVYQGSKIQNHRWWLSSTWYHDPRVMLLPHAGSTLSLVVSFLLWHSSVYINPALSAPSPIHLALCPCALFSHSMADELPGLFQNCMLTHASVGRLVSLFRMPFLAHSFSSVASLFRRCCFCKALRGPPQLA